MTDATHECPRPGCSRRVSAHQFACRDDWFALPRDLREAIWAGWLSGDLAAHGKAMADGRRWYREHTGAEEVEAW